MSIFTPLEPYRLEIELVVAAVLVVFFSIAWIHHDHVVEKRGENKILVADEKATKQQAAKDQAKIKVAESTHGKELDDIKNAYLEHPIPVPNPARLYVHTGSPNSVSKDGSQSSPSPPAPMVQDDCRLYRDRREAFELLLKRADGLSADTRELNSEVH